MAENRGKYIIVGIFAVGLLAAGSAWWYRFSQTRQAALFWGGPGAETILRAEKIELLTLQESPPGSKSGEAIVDDTGSLYVTQVYDVTQTRGMLNARNALVHDSSLNFTAAPAGTPHWQYALRFRGEATPVTVLFDFKAARAKAAGHPGVVGIEPIAEGLQILFNEAKNASKEPRT